MCKNFSYCSIKYNPTPKFVLWFTAGAALPVVILTFFSRTLAFYFTRKSK